MQISQSLATFTSKHELNEAVRKHLYFQGHKLNKIEKALLKKISQYSCKFFGVAWPSLRVLSQALKVSESTVKRARKHLLTLGIILRADSSQRRKGDGEFSSAVYIIQPAAYEKELPSSTQDDLPNDLPIKTEMTSREVTETPDVPTVRPNKNVSETKSFSLSLISSDNVLNNVNNVQAPTLEIDSEIQPWFSRLIKPFANDPLLIADLWESLIYAMRKVKRTTIGVMQLRNAVKSLQKKMKKNDTDEPARYFYGAIYNQLTGSTKTMLSAQIEYENVLVDDLPAGVKWQMEQASLLQESEEKLIKDVPALQVLIDTSRKTLLKQDKLPLSFGKPIVAGEGQGIDAFPEFVDRLQRLRSRR
ncbi:helix-turn-helix domain-containing protein [Brevibacillus sp. NPDC003359]|uniref:helix-turn-helix domain-containing protein n=1 Tax=unclassified Brevibacillus TaxID=2684853 RepID=UPI0036A45C20